MANNLRMIMQSERTVLHPLVFTWWELLVLVGAVMLFMLQVLVASPRKSAAFDEQYHLTAGYSYMRTGDVRLATTHPPLMGMLAALPLLFQNDIALPLDHPAWQAGDRFLYSDVFLWEANSDPQGLLLTARRPIMAVGVLLVLVVYFWMRSLIGRNNAEIGALVVLLFTVFDPNLLGNARVVTTDLGLSCFLLLAMWRLWCWLEYRSGFNLITVGVCAGLALSAKFTGLFFWPAALMVVLLYPNTQPDNTFIGTRLQRLAGLFSMGLVALGVLWAVYGFSFGAVPDGQFSLPLPAPFYWQQLYNTLFRIINLQGARYDFFWGEASNQGWWSYFPVALAVKTPLPMLLLSMPGLGLAVHRLGWRKASVLWVLPLLFILLGLSGVLTIGYRHILPIVPFLLLFCGYSATAMLALRTGTNSVRSISILDGSFHRGRARITPSQVALFALLAWHIFGAVRIYPHQESFFNELAGDWYNWSNLLVDSNLDWGQDLPALRAVMADNHIEDVNLAYFGKAVPEAYGVRYRPLPGYLRFVDGIELNAYNPYTPEPGWYAISATSLRLGLHQPETLDLYALFRTRRPDARAGYSIYLYKIVDPPGVSVERKVVVDKPVYTIEPETLGFQPSNRIQVKWLQGAPPGLEPIIFSLGAGFSPVEIQGYQAVDANFDNVFTLLGYVQTSTFVAAPVDQDALPVITLYWEVGSQPMPMLAPTKGAPLAAFVHLTNPGNPDQKIAQFDGWPTALRGLEPGDVIAQSVPMEVMFDASPGAYDLLVGLYSPQTFGRLIVTNRPGAPDVVLAGQIAVQ